MNEQELKDRTKKFALRVIRLVRALPRTAEGRTLGTQLLRAGTSSAAHYRSACRARSRAEFGAKLGIAEEEADGSVFWIELMIESGMVKSERVSALLQEANELVAILTASRKTVVGKTVAVRRSQSKIENQKSKM